MIIELKNRTVSMLIRTICIAGTVGFIVGLILVAIHISDNNYYSHGLYNLMLYDLQNYAIKYTLISITIALLIIFSSQIVRQIMRLMRVDSNTIESYSSLIAIIILIWLVAIIFYFYNVQIIEFSPHNNNLLPITKYFILRPVIFGSVIIFSTALIAFVYIYMSNKTGLSLSFRSFVSKILTLRFSIFSGMSIFTLIVLLTLFTYIQKNKNYAARPNFIVITIDTLRADHLGVYGYERDTSPNIDKLAAEGILFENAFAQSPWTLPSMASMHTSVYPSIIPTNTAYDKINKKFTLLSEYLKNNNYKTIAVISNLLVSHHYGFNQGYDIFDEQYMATPEDVTSELLSDRAIKYLGENSDEKFFLWLHYFDPHGYYVDHEDITYGSEYTGHLPRMLKLPELNMMKSELTNNDIKYAKDIYDEEILYTDKQIGLVLDEVEKLGLKDNTVIILTSDHGEEFLERTKFGHGKSLYQELIHVPLIIYNPLEKNLNGKSISANVELRDITKTIVDISGLETKLFAGNNLMKIDDKEEDSNYIYSEGTYGWGIDDRRKGIISGEWKLIKNLDDNSFELYNIKSDPQEKLNLISSKNSDVIDIRTLLISKLPALTMYSSTEATKANLSEEELQRLKALGYIQ